MSRSRMPGTAFKPASDQARISEGADPHRLCWVPKRDRTATATLLCKLCLTNRLILLKSITQLFVVHLETPSYPAVHLAMPSAMTSFACHERQLNVGRTEYVTF